MKKYNILFVALTVIAATTFNLSGQGVTINGVTWATCNVDKPGIFAANPEDAGMFYQWNRKVGWSATDPLVNSDGGTTWNPDLETGITGWEKANDPCPAGWRVPTLEEMKNLLYATDRVNEEWTTVTGIDGRKFTDNENGMSIFLPAAGYRSDNDGTLGNAGLFGYYWFLSGISYMAFGSGGAFLYNVNTSIRRFGYSVRCVADSGIGVDGVATHPLQLYPNPAQDYFYINGIEENTPITISDITGKVVLQSIVSPNEAVSVTHLPQGVYIVQVAGKTMKVIKSEP